MSILVDTSVWSLALRKKGKSFPEEAILSQLIADGLVKIIGPIRQELLSGMVDNKQFEKLKKNLSYFPDLNIKSSDFERGAEFFNLCRKRGIQGSHTDFLICAVAYSYDLQIFTTDKDFVKFKKVLPIKMYGPGKGFAN